MGVDLQRHPLSAAFGDMPTDEYNELVADVKRHGLITPVVYVTDERGHKLILDGWHRYRACIEAGVTPRLEPFDFVVEPATEQSGRTMTQAEFVVAQNAHRRHLTREQRRNIVVELLKAKPEASDRAIASMAKADHKTVGAVRREAEAGGEIPHLTKRVGRDGKRQPATTAQLAKPFPAKAVAQEMARRHGHTNLLVSMGKLERVAVDGVEVIAPPAEKPKGAHVAVDVRVVREATRPREVAFHVERSPGRAEPMDDDDEPVAVPATITPALVAQVAAREAAEADAARRDLVSVHIFRLSRWQEMLQDAADVVAPALKVPEGIDYAEISVGFAQDLQDLVDDVWEALGKARRLQDEQKGEAAA